MPESQTLPPTKDCLSLHHDRANFVVRVLKLSLELHPLNLNPTAHGCAGGNQSLQIKQMSKKPAPDSLFEYISCKANNSCSTQRCRCQSNGLKCTDVCGCSNCQNSMRDDKNEEDENEYVESKDGSDFDTENYSSDNESV